MGVVPLSQWWEAAVNKEAWQEGLRLVQDLNAAVVADCQLHLDAQTANHNNPAIDHDVDMVD
jgi:hypothetical protein